MSNLHDVSLSVKTHPPYRLQIHFNTIKNGTVDYIFFKKLQCTHLLLKLIKKCSVFPRHHSSMHESGEFVRSLTGSSWTKRQLETS